MVIERLEKDLAILDMELKNVKNLILKLEKEYKDTDLKKHLNIIKVIREDVQNKLIELS